MLLLLLHVWYEASAWSRAQTTVPTGQALGVQVVFYIGPGGLLCKSAGRVVLVVVEGGGGGSKWSSLTGSLMQQLTPVLYNMLHVCESEHGLLKNECGFSQHG